MLDSLELDQVVLVGHDASGPDAIDYTLHEPSRVVQLVLLNSYYGHAPTLRLPEMIRLLADHELRPLADAMIADRPCGCGCSATPPASSDSTRQTSAASPSPRVQPQFFGDADSPDALAAVRAWTAALFSSLDRQDANINQVELGQRRMIPQPVQPGRQGWRRYSRHRGRRAARPASSRARQPPHAAGQAAA